MGFLDSSGTVRRLQLREQHCSGPQLAPRPQRRDQQAGQDPHRLRRGDHRHQRGGPPGRPHPRAAGGRGEAGAVLCCAVMITN